MTNYPKFSDFAKGEPKLDGEKIKLKDVLNQEILIINYAIHRSKFKDENYLTNSRLISLIASHAERLGIHNPLEDVVRRSSW